MNNPTIVMPITFLFYILFIVAYKAYKVWLITRPGYVEAHLLTKLHSFKVYWIKTYTENKIECFKVGDDVYQIDPACVYTIGHWKVPTVYYNEGIANALNLETITASQQITSNELYDAQEQHIARDILNTILEPAISNGLMLIVIVLVVISGLIYIGYNGNKQSTQTQTQITELQNKLFPPANVAPSINTIPTQPTPPTLPITPR